MIWNIRSPFLLACALLYSLAANAQGAVRPQDHLVFKEHDTPRCLKCHGMPNFAFRDSAASKIHDFSVDAVVFRGSVHAKVDCQQCHPEIKQYPHEFAAERPRVGCGNDCHAADSTGKTYTHLAVMKEFETSAHKSGLTRKNPDSPECTTCHGDKNPHAVRKVKKAITVAEKMALCVSCHDDGPMMIRNKVDPQAVSSYKGSFHYKAIRFGQTTTAVCQDCHTVHHILPKDSLLSSISAANIAATCGQEKCHPGAKMNFAMSGANHLAMRVEREPILSFMEKFFMILTLGTMAMLAAGIVLDVQKKFGWLTLSLRLARTLIGSLARLKVPLRGALRITKKILID